MPAAPYAPRYARALADVLGRKPEEMDRASRELGDFQAALGESAGLRQVLLDPSVPATRKLAILDRLRGPLELSNLVRNFLAVVLDHERMEGLAEILRSFRDLVRADEHISEVEWTSARPLNDGERQALEQRLQELTGGRVEATFREDPALLGGARLRIGSTVYDGSVRARLEGLREKLQAQ